MNDLCREMHLLIQADLDGELMPAEVARVAAHVQNCPACTAVQAELLFLSTRLRAEVPHYPAPETVRVAVRAFIEAEAAPTPRRVAGLPQRFGRWPSFGAGFALAAGLALAILLPRENADLSEAIVADHIRALQPGHLVDVVSTDQHTVKPWFDGRIDFAPPVKDFKADGYPLAGGRLDYIGGREVAALIYRRRQHVIEVLVWPTPESAGQGTRNGYNFVHWSQEKMTLWAVSDLNTKELNDFVQLWQK